MSTQRIVISGAGIAGLTLGVALSRAGFNNILIVEKDLIFRISTAGIHLKATAMGILNKLGITDLGAVSAVCDTVRMVNQYGFQGSFHTQKNGQINHNRSIRCS